MTAQKASFDHLMETHQIAWRKKSGNVTTQKWGRQNGREYEWILPREEWEQSLWPGIRTGTTNALNGAPETQWISVGDLKAGLQSGVKPHLEYLDFRQHQRAARSKRPAPPTRPDEQTQRVCSAGALHVH